MTLSLDARLEESRGAPARALLIRAAPSGAHVGEGARGGLLVVILNVSALPESAWTRYSREL